MAYTINLIHRGPQVIECIDLFDEARYGADKLFFRGRFKTADEVKSQVAIALGDESKLVLPEGKKKEDYGVGNPLSKEEELQEGEVLPTIALNRYYIPNKKFWNNVVPDVENPYKASAAVRFSIRVHFCDDFAYIDFGCPWEKVDDGKLTTSSNAETFINNFTLLRCHFISKEDALEILKGIFKDYKEAFSESVTVPQIVEEEIMTTELIDEDGTIIAL